MTELTLFPDLPAFRDQAKLGNVVAVWAELTADFDTPVSAYAKIRDAAQGSFLLESGEHNEASGRYSFLGSNPRAVLTAKGREMTLTEQGHSKTWTTETEPLDELEKLMARYRPAPSRDLPDFFGGAVGFLSYDMIRFFEPTVGSAPPDELGLPECVFMLADSVVIFDHRYRKIMVLCNVCLDDYNDVSEAYKAGHDSIYGLIAKLEQPLPVKPLPYFKRRPGQAEAQELHGNTTRAEYEEMVRAGQEFIKAGDIFQFVPSQRFEKSYGGSALDLFRALRHVNPSPYMFCIEFPQGFSLVGCSPEVHVKCQQGRIDIRPLAGTRWRGKTEEEDAALALDLKNDPKECAEHLMLVDLARNDVGRVSEYKSVEVTEFMIIEQYSHVMHLVSHVTGTLLPDKTAYDVMRATFPAGTVSGSPKVRAMQIINDLEKSKRCAYAGAIGYFGFDGNLDSCIALRTCVLKDGKAYVQAGAGVVADSDPASEYQETVNKAAAMLRAVDRANAVHTHA